MVRSRMKVMYEDSLEIGVEFCSNNSTLRTYQTIIIKSEILRGVLEN